jgi:hypothetical protein
MAGKKHAIRIAIIILLLFTVSASVGDVDPKFQHCSIQCFKKNACEENKKKNVFGIVMCYENCRYDCMQYITSRRIKEGLPILKV